MKLELASYGEVHYANTNKTNISNLLYFVYVCMPLLHGHLLALYYWKDEFCSIFSVVFNKNDRSIDAWVFITRVSTRVKKEWSEIAGRGGKLVGIFVWPVDGIMVVNKDFIHMSLRLMRLYYFKFNHSRLFKSTGLDKRMVRCKIIFNWSPSVTLQPWMTLSSQISHIWTPAALYS